jgi:Type IX secretion system protein PorV
MRRTTKRTRAGYIPLLGLLSLGVLRLPAHAASADAGTSSAPFLELEQGARPIGMGGAYAAVADDADSIWWNPAGLAHAGREVTIDDVQYIQNINSQYIAGCAPLPNGMGTLGASFTYFTVPGIQGYNSSGAPTGNLADYAYAVSVAYGVSLTKELSIGANLKGLGETLDTTNASGFAADVGAQYRVGAFGAGFSAQNLGPSLKVGSVSSPLPEDLRGGVFYAPLSSLTLALDDEFPRDQDSVIHIGGEWQIVPVFGIRLGYEASNTPGTANGLTAGFNFTTLIGGAGDSVDSTGDAEGTAWLQRQGDLIQNARKTGQGYLLSLDYAFMAASENLGSVNRVSLTLHF